MATLLLLWAIKVIVNRRIEISTPAAALPLLTLAVFGLAQCISITGSGGRRLSLSMDVDATRAAVFAMLSLLVAFLIASNFFAGRQKLRVLANFLVIYGMAMALFALVRQLYGGHNLLYWLTPNRDGSVSGTFLYRNHFAGHMELLMLIPIALSLARGLPGWTRLFYGFAAAVMGVAAIESQSRGGMISLAAGMMFIVIMGTRLRDQHSRGQLSIRSKWERWHVLSRHAVVVAVIALVIIGGVFSLGAAPVIHRVEETLHQMAKANPPADFTTGRRQIWKTTASMIQANPYFGIGFGAFRTAYPLYNDGQSSSAVGQAHNDYLQALSDCGVVGGAFALWFVVVIFRTIGSAIRSPDPLLAQLALGGGAGIFAILVHSLFDFNLQLISNALIFLLILAIESHVSATTTRRDTGGVRRRLVQFSLLGLKGVPSCGSRPLICKD
jgi:O-antigen ligase